MKKRLIILLAFISGFFGLLLAIPKAPTMKPSRLARQLPLNLGNWEGSPVEPGTQEKKILAKDTEFERMSYRDPMGRLPPIEVSLVFSGKNVTTSIHRPEVCLRAQGWTFLNERHLKLEGILPGDEILPVKEIVCRRPFLVEGPEEDRIPRILENGEEAMIYSISYYTFFGHENIVSGHYERTSEDMKDRLFKGYDQRWAYATFSSMIYGRFEEQGIGIGSIEPLGEDETRNHLQSFLKELLPIVVSPSHQGVDQSLEDRETEL
jgi:hypothetical protein